MFDKLLIVTDNTEEELKFYSQFIQKKEDEGTCRTAMILLY